MQYPNKMPVFSNNNSRGYYIDKVMSTTHLKEVVFEKVPHRLVRWDRPPSVEVKVEDVEPEDEDERRQLRLVAHGHQDHQDAAYNVLHDLK
jgi:hypothetical protein